MIAVKGNWYDGSTSNQTSAVLRIFDNGAIQIEDSIDGHVLFKQSQFSADISDRIGTAPRFLSFSNGCNFETEDNLAIDRLAKKLHFRKWNRWVHFLESKKRYVLLAIITVLLFMAGMIKYGIPATANLIAIYLPRSYYELADREVLKTLDLFFLMPSDLSNKTKDRLQKRFQTCIDTHQSHAIKIVFKKGGQLGPNALALPGGTIIFTDELVEIAENDEELIAILAHEIGHVVYRHGMRRMVQDSLLSFAAMAFTGNASGISEIFLGLPVILTELAYSREFERDADNYALNYLLSNQIPPNHFADILLRIQVKSKEIPEKDRGSKLKAYLSTHPPTEERIEAFQSQEKQ
jgi:Zn-dependent protease with chaperone function